MTDPQKRKLIEPRNLKGFRDLLPAQALAKFAMTSVLQKVFESFGYLPIETPHLEYAECLLGDAGAEIQKQVFRFKDQGDRDVALRFDLTVPFARYISQHKNELGVPFKRWAIANVFRGENPQAGRYREFTQCDFDFVGVPPGGADAEIVQVIYRALTALKLERFVIRINNRRVMNGLIELLGVSDRTSSLLIVVDKIDKLPPEEFERQLREDIKLSAEQLKQLREFLELSRTGDSLSALKRCRALAGTNAEMLAGITELEQLVGILAAVGVPAKNFAIDFSIVRGLGYYTGAIFETVLQDAPQFGSVCSGGRYDNLTLTFQKEKLPGVGASVGLDRLLAALEELKAISSRGTPAAVLITVPTEEHLIQAHQVAAWLRAAKVPSEVFPEATKLGKQLKYAERHGHPFAVLFPSTAAGSFVLEKLSDRSQQTFTADKTGAETAVQTIMQAMRAG